MGAGLVVACFTGGSGGDAGADASDATPLPEVAALFSTSCAMAGCHLGADAPFHLDLSPSAYYVNLVDVPANEVAGVMRVKPGAASDTQSYLLCKVDPECTAVAAHMPVGGSLTTTYTSGRASQPLLIDAPASARTLTVWFENSDRTGCTEWDSRYGANYTFAIAP